MTSTSDTPRTAYRALEKRATLGTVVLLLALAGLAWASTVHQSHQMGGMLTGLTSVRGHMAFDMTAPVFLAMWTTMMVAMMFPTIAPIVLLHRMVMQRRQAGPWPTVSFVAGYLLVWSVVGVLPLFALVGLGTFRDSGTWVERVAGSVLVLVGAYQFTRWKTACQKACRSPLTFLSTHDFGTGMVGTLRAGVLHGLYCLGCCWALMTVLLVVGVMNLAWMAGIAVVFLLEKHWHRGDALTYVVGTALVVYGLAVVVHPGWLPGGLPIGGSGSMTMG